MAIQELTQEELQEVAGGWKLSGIGSIVNNVAKSVAKSVSAGLPNLGSQVPQGQSITSLSGADVQARIKQVLSSAPPQFASQLSSAATTLLSRLGR